jgi:uncharacterized membrane protein YfcA
MLEQYKKTFLGVQVLSLVVSGWVYFGLTHYWVSAALVFLTMQVGGVFGALWASRLSKKMQQNPLYR